MSARVKGVSLNGSLDDLFRDHKPGSDSNSQKQETTKGDSSKKKNQKRKTVEKKKPAEKNEDGQTIGSNGGIIGRPKSTDKKVQAHVTCTASELEMYKAAAEKDHRTFPSFVNAAIYEYIENHGLK